MELLRECGADWQKRLCSDGDWKRSLDSRTSSEARRGTARLDTSTARLHMLVPSIDNNLFPQDCPFKLKQSLNHSTRVLREWRAVQKFTRGFCWIKRFSSFITSKIVNSVSWLNDKWTTSKDRDIHPCVALTLQPLVVLSTAESHPPHTNNYIRLVITPGYPSLRSSNTATLLLTLQSRSCVENCV